MKATLMHGAGRIEDAPDPVVQPAHADVGRSLPRAVPTTTNASARDTGPLGMRSTSRKRRAITLLGLLGVGALAPAASWLARASAEDIQSLPADDPLPVALPETADRSLLLPDLQPVPPQSLSIDSDRANRTREIRFSTTTANVGEGPLEMRGTFNPETGLTRATQRIASRDGDGMAERVAGEFEVHPDHNHWHFESFTEFELWTYAPGGTLDRLVTTTGKMTFCLMDTGRIASAPPGSPARATFTGCGDQTQGISVGWQDTYSSTTPGQELDITGLPDGRYAIRSTVDPENRLMETDDTNNATVVYVELSGTSVERLPNP